MSAERDVFLKIFAHSKDSVFLLDPQSKKILYANPKSEEDTSYESAELEGLVFEELFLEEDRPAIATLLETTLQWKTGVDPQRLMRRKTGRKLIVEINTSEVNWGASVALFCNVRDITARVKAEEKIRSYSEELEKMNAELEQRVQARTAELAAQKLQLDDMMNHIQQAIFTVSPTLVINSEHSRFVLEVFGAQDVTGRKVEEFLFPDAVAAPAALVRDSLALIFAQPETWEMVQDLLPREIVYRGSRDLMLEWVAMRETAEATAPIAKVMVICQDVTERKKLQAQIAEQQSINQERMDVLAKMLSLPAAMVGTFMAEIRRLSQESQTEIAVFVGEPSEEVAQKLMRALHTLKGALGQLRIKSASTVAHELESAVQARRQAEDARLKLARAKQGLEKLSGSRAETLKFRVATHEKEIHESITAFPRRIEDSFRRLQTALEQFEEFYTRVFGSRAAQNDADGADSIAVSFKRLSALLEHEEFRASQVRRGMQWILQAPLTQLFQKLEQSARSTAQDLGRDIQIAADSNQIELDRRLLNPLSDALMHVVRNSVDHGGAGRTQPTQLTWTATREDAQTITITLSDDGNGIDTQKLKTKAVEKKLKTQSEADAASEDALLRWIFLPGLSTQDQVTEVSGRGVGMDQVLQVIEKQCGGKVTVKSKKGQGTQVSVRIPNDLPPPQMAPLNFPTDDVMLQALVQTVFGDQAASTAAGMWVQRPEIPSPIAGKVPSQRSLFLSSLELTEPALSTLSNYFGEGSARSNHLLSPVTQELSRFGRSWLKAWRRSEGFTSHSTAISSILDPGSKVQEVRIRDYGTKADVIGNLFAFVQGIRGFSGLPELVGVVCEELIMNAMFDAPRDAEGKAKYNHLPRTHALVLEENETVSLRYGADSQFFCVSIEDTAGALRLETVRDYLIRCLKKGTDQVENKAGGAGLGLYTLFDSSNGLVMRVTPGKTTEVCVVFALCRSHKEYQQSGRALSFVTRS